MTKKLILEAAETQIIFVRVEHKICSLKCKICNKEIFKHNRNMGNTLLYPKEVLYYKVKAIMIQHIMMQHLPELKIIREKMDLKLQRKNKKRRILNASLLTKHNVDDLWDLVYKYHITKKGEKFVCNNCHREFSKMSYSIRHFQRTHEIRADNAPKKITQKTYENPWNDPESMYCDSDFLSQYTGKTIKKTKKCSDKKQHQ